MAEKNGKTTTETKAATKATKGTATKDGKAAKAPKDAPATEAHGGAAPSWIETIVTAEGLLGISLGRSVDEVAKVIKTKDDPTEPNAVLRSKVGGREVSATFTEGALGELAVFMTHTKEDEHKADFKALKAYLTARHGKAKGKPAFPSWRVEGTSPYRLWLSSWKGASDDFGRKKHYSKIVMDVHADAD